MEIQKIEINHLDKPLGYRFDSLMIQAFVKAVSYPRSLEKHLVINDDLNEVVFDSGWQEALDLKFYPKLQLQAQTRYKVLLELRANQESWQKVTWFETGLMSGFSWGKWIGTNKKELHGISLSKEFSINKPVYKARLYLTGLGLYEAYLDGKKIGNEYLAPGFSDYNYYVQVATHDVTKYLTPGKHTLSITLADGWYRGKFGIEMHGGRENQYGDTLKAIAELHWQDEVGKQVLATDDSWICQTSQVVRSGIYYGEDLDMLQSKKETYPVVSYPQPSKYVYDRISLPITAHEQFSVKKVMTTRKHDVILDFGQNLAGWVEFEDMLAAGQKVEIEFGEIIQNGELYRDNLRNARASFTYVSDGKGQIVHPHFTYFGFRYVRLINFPTEINPANFKAVALYSDMEEIGTFKTSDSLVNRLYQNVVWGLKSNFVDIPTDCPQRDERLGWTGDAGIFAKTASYIMDTYQFFTKYALDIAVEQSKNEGRVPLYAPAIDGNDGGKAVWGDAITIIPWISYQRSGDATILRKYIGAMMSWVDWIYDRAEKLGNPYLWLGDDQLGDWLALDTEDIMHLKGKTPDDLIASAYYYYSARIVAQAAEILKMKHERRYYQQLAKQIKAAFQAEFFTKSGRLITDTQTGLAVVLNFGLVPACGKQQAIKKLVTAVSKNKNSLTTGFVGTPQLLPALSANGYHELAMRLFLSEHYPSWLFEVKQGATTIWERWNSLDEKGMIADNGMNSLNHYSSGAVMQWAFEYLMGLKQVGEHEIRISPGLTPKVSLVAAKTRISDGEFGLTWQIKGVTKQEVSIELEIPYGTSAKLELPNCQNIVVNGQKMENEVSLGAGKYQLEYQATSSYVESFDVQSPLKEFNQNKNLIAGLKDLVPFWDFLTLPGNMKYFEDYSLLQLGNEMRAIGFAPLSSTDIKAINAYFQKYALK